MAHGSTAAAGGDDLTARAPTREVHEYDLDPALPEFVADPGALNTNTWGPLKTIGLHLLSPLEEKAAARRSGGDPMSLAYELAMMALAEINGRKLSMADGTKDLAFSELHPKVRNLVVQGYADMAVATDATTKVFLKSRRIKV